MARTALFSAGLGALIAWSWGRLEAPHPSLAALARMTALGIVPALVPRRARVPAAVGALAIAASLALEVYRPWAIGTALHRLASGFLDFYDVLVPFDGSVHPLMHGVVLLAVSIF